MLISDLLAALRDRWALALTIGAAAFLLIVVWISVQPRVYEASSSLLFNISEPDPSLSAQERANTSSSNLLGTQSDIITSTFVAQAVVEKLAEENGNAEVANDELIGRARDMLSKIRVVQGRSSNVLEIVASDKSAEDAAYIANAFASTYLEKQRDLREIAATGYANWLDERTQDVRQRLNEAQQKLAEAQRERGLIGIDRLDLEAERLRALNAELAASEGAAASAGSLSGAGNVSQVQFSGAVQSLESAVAAKNVEIADLSRTLGPNHPDMIAARSELATLQSELSAARSRAAQALAADSASSQRREAELRARMRAQQDRLISLSEGQEELAVLQQDVDTARQTYESVRQRFGDVAVRSVISQTNATQLDLASAPTAAAKPNVPLLAVLGLLFSLGLGISVVFLFEFLDPRIRTEEGIEATTGRQVIANFSRPRFGRLFGSSA